MMAPVLVHAHPVPLGDVPRLDHVVNGGGQACGIVDYRVQTGMFRKVRPDGAFPNSLTQPPSNCRGTRPSCEIISWDDKSIEYLGSRSVISTSAEEISCLCVN